MAAGPPDMSDAVVQALMARQHPNYEDMLGDRVAEPFLNQLATDPRFNTKLTPEQEKLFQAWKAKIAPQDSGYDYDFRGAFLKNMSPDPATQHWDDTFKKPNHSTFSIFSQYAKQMPQMAGSWNGNTYIPPVYPVPVPRPQR